MNLGNAIHAAERDTMTVAGNDFNVRLLKALGLENQRCREVEIRMAVNDLTTVKALCYLTDEHGKALAEELEWREFHIYGPRENETRWRLYEIERRKDMTWAGWFRWVFGSVRY
jgi:hypothetical protein